MIKHIFYSLLILFISVVFYKQAQANWSIDNNIWVYHDLFVQRFNMKPEYVDNELSGARAVAIRLVPLARRRCHKSKSGEECVPSWQWLIDLYIDIDQDIGIEGDSPRQFKPWRSSLYFLARKNPELRKRWEEVFGLKGGRLYLGGQNEKTGRRREVPFEIFSYKRPIKEGLMMIQARINEEIILADPAEKRIIEFSDANGRLLHRITIPASYWPRVAELRRKYASITEKNWKGGVEKDPHIWVYTKEFARKYKMPKENISEEMEGAMAMAFRMDSYGTYSSIEFSVPERMNFPDTELWDIYLPKDAKLYYADPTIDNYYGGFHPSTTFVHEKTNRSDWEGTFPALIAGGGLINGSVHIVRNYAYIRKLFFFKVKTNDFTRWYGGSISNHSYIQAKVLKTEFTFTEYLDDYSYAGKEQYFVFGDSLNNVLLRYFFYTDFYKAKIPFDFMKKTLSYRKKNMHEKRKYIRKNKE